MFQRFKKKVQYGWMRFQISLRRELWRDKQPLQLLQYCSRSILKYPEFDLLPSNRKAVVYAPQRAKDFTEIMAQVSEALTTDASVKVVYKLGPFRKIDALGFLNTEAGCIDNGRAHMLHHVAVIEQITQYLTQPLQEGLSFSNYNRRTLQPMVSDFQAYVDSILALYTPPQ